MRLAEHVGMLTRDAERNTQVREFVGMTRSWMLAKGHAPTAAKIARDTTGPANMAQVGPFFDAKKLVIWSNPEGRNVKLVMTP
jgi:hypothetical protein